MKATLDYADWKKLCKLIDKTDSIAGFHEDNVNEGEVCEYPIRLKWKHYIGEGMKYTLEIETKEEASKI